MFVTRRRRGSVLRTYKAPPLLPPYISLNAVGGIPTIFENAFEKCATSENEKRSEITCTVISVSKSIVLANSIFEFNMYVYGVTPNVFLNSRHKNETEIFAYFAISSSVSLAFIVYKFFRGVYRGKIRNGPFRKMRKLYYHRTKKRFEFLRYI